VLEPDCRGGAFAGRHRDCIAGGRFEMWLTIYGAAFSGWLLSIAVPMVWQVAFELALDARTRRYQVHTILSPRNGPWKSRTSKAIRPNRGGRI